MAESKQKPISVIYLYQREEATRALDGITLAGIQSDTETSTDGSEKLQTGITEEPLALSVSDRKECTSCSVKFEDREEQKEHYKSDWHRFNLKQKLKGLESVSETRFEEVAGGDLSSISGSDSDSDADAASSHPTAADDEDDDASVHVEGIGRRHPKVFFRNALGDLLSVYRCVLHSKKNRASSQQELLSPAQEMPSRMKWAILLTAGGHFAGAIIDREKVVVHKTFHRYVVRAKRGTVQSVRDKQGHAPSSAGAHIRRYNEAALTQEIQELLESWAKELAQCDCIFIRSPSYNKMLYFSGKSPALQKADLRIRQIPFITRRPTFNELKRVHDLLSAVHCYGKTGNITDHIKVSPKKPSIVKAKAKDIKQPELRERAKDRQADLEMSSYSSGEEEGPITLGMEDLSINLTELRQFEGTRKPRNRKKKNKADSEESPPVCVEDTPICFQQVQPAFDDAQYKLRNSLYTSCKIGDLAMLQEFIQPILANSDTDDHEHVINSTDISKQQSTSHIMVLNEPFGNQGMTLLHVASSAGCSEAIETLMLAGADPSVRDLKGAVPYAVSKDKETRQAFRRFMGKYPEKYDYLTAQIPSPLTDEMESVKKAREAERRKAQKKVRKEKLKEKKEEERKIKEEKNEKERFLALSDREKRALAAERRLVSQKTKVEGAAPCLSRCFQCGSDITGKVPFEYLDNRFCSTKCLKEHRLNNKQSKV